MPARRQGRKGPSRKCELARSPILRRRVSDDETLCQPEAVLLESLDPSLPLDSGRRLGGDVIDDAVDDAHLIDNLEASRVPIGPFAFL